jgi:polar amino acid transport system substrate-binding protein
MQSGSIQELFVTEQIPVAKEFKRVSATTDGFLMVSEGKADVCACAIANGRLYAQANEGLAIANDFTFYFDETTQGTRIGIPLGETELTEFVNTVIAELRERGDIDKWYEEYEDYAASLGI